MTLPYERTRAVMSAEQFLQDLIDPGKTPRVPRQIRMRARSLLRHYPSSWEMDRIAEKEDTLSSRPLDFRIFGKKF